MKCIRLTFLLGFLLMFGRVMGQESPALLLERRPSTGRVLGPVRETVALYLDHIRHRRGREAFALTTRTSGTSWGNDFPEVLARHEVFPQHQLGGEDHAMVVSNPFGSRGRTEVFYAMLVKKEGDWLIRRGGRVTPEESQWMMRGYLTDPEVKPDILPLELVGRWWAPCDSTIVFSLEGKGTELCVGPGGPEPDQKPEAFTWEIDGNKLTRDFSDRKEVLEITWVDDDSVGFLESNGTGSGLWYRRE